MLKTKTTIGCIIRYYEFFEKKNLYKKEYRNVNKMFEEDLELFNLKAEDFYVGYANRLVELAAKVNPEKGKALKKYFARVAGLLSMIDFNQILPRIYTLKNEEFVLIYELSFRQEDISFLKKERNMTLEELVVEYRENKAA